MRRSRTTAFMAAMVLVFFSFSTNTSHTVTGKVVDENQTALQGVRVSFGDQVTHTNKGGLFSLTIKTKTDVKTVTITLRKWGYHAQRVRVTLGESSETYELSLVELRL